MEKKINDFYNQISQEDLKEMAKREYKRLQENPNNYSYWYPKVVDCGINIVKSFIFQIPFEIVDEERKYMYDLRGSLDNYKNFIKEQVKDLDEFKPYNIKNGTFSDKFDARNCFCYRDEIPTRFSLIEYSSCMMETDGNTELVVREVIETSNKNVCSIYNGLPLRPEFRAFVDFDTKKVLYIVNYWDYDYCRPHLSSKNDQVIFDNQKDYLEQKFSELKDSVYILLKENIFKSELSGKWSVDILYEPDTKTFWLIDMALAHRSAYYERERCDYNE